jgi:hypothetical protein
MISTACVHCLDSGFGVDFAPFVAFACFFLWLGQPGH